MKTMKFVIVFFGAIVLGAVALAQTTIDVPLPLPLSSIEALITENGGEPPPLPPPLPEHLRATPEQIIKLFEVMKIKIEHFHVAAPIYQRYIRQEDADYLIEFYQTQIAYRLVFAQQQIVRELLQMRSDADTVSQNNGEGKIKAPVLIYKTEPIYPESAKESGISGDVLLRVITEEDGNVRSVHVLHGDQVLADAAISAVSRWRYEPALSLFDGKPVIVGFSVCIRFLPDGTVDLMGDIQDILEMNEIDKMVKEAVTELLDPGWKRNAE